MGCNSAWLNDPHHIAVIYNANPPAHDNSIWELLCLDKGPKNAKLD